MAQQTINAGTVANDGTGDPLRTAFGKVNANFIELYAGQAGNATAIAAEATARTSAGYLTNAALAGYATTSSVTAAINAAVAGLPPSSGGGLASFQGRTAVAAVLSTADVIGVLASGLPVAQGGTGATSAAAALSALGAYPAANPAGYITSAALSGYATSSSVTTALGSYLTATAAAAAYQTAAQVDARVQAGAGVTTFNTRAGAVTLTAADVIAVLTTWAATAPTSPPGNGAPWLNGGLLSFANS